MKPTKEEYGEMLRLMVAGGYISQEQADNDLANYDNMVVTEIPSSDELMAQQDFEKKICKSCGSYDSDPSKHECQDKKDGLRTLATMADLTTGKPETLKAMDFEHEQVIEGEKLYAMKTGQGPVDTDTMPLPESWFKRTIKEAPRG